MCPQVSHTPTDTCAEYHGPIESDERAKSNSNVPVTLWGCRHLGEAIPVLDGLELSTDCNANHVAYARWTSTGKARSPYHDATPGFQIVKRVILRIRSCQLLQSGRISIFHMCRSWE